MELWGKVSSGLQHGMLRGNTALQRPPLAMPWGEPCSFADACPELPSCYGVAGRCLWRQVSSIDRTG